VTPAILQNFAIPEFRFGDFLVPWGMVIGTIGFVIAWGVVAVMERTGWTRQVWNLPLFFVALAVIFGCLAGLIFAP
jgi:mannitol-specific phosphotransferase system IIBC component